MKILSILFLVVIFLSACQTNKESVSAIDHSAHEPFRSQYHFTPATGWMNDPNGMVYYDGEYHLFYQYYPDSTVWGPMHWGHAVSTDMIHWEHLPIALYPDSLGYIFSGSAVVDWKNTSDFGMVDKPAMVAIFTYHDPESDRAGRVDFQTQGIAYSLDKGRTWIKYKNNPVLPNPGIRDFRDPKVSWNDISNQWIMTLAVKDHIEFYASADLKQWHKLSEFGQSIGAHGGVWECPDLFSLSDEQGKKRWILFVSINPGGPQRGSATQYFVGDFDGQNFISQDTVTRWIDYGADNYAGVTWSDIPASDGRRLFMGWMSNWQYATVVPTQLWRSAMTLPREVMLHKKHQGYELKFRVVKEIEDVQQEPRRYTGSAVVDNPLFRLDFNLEEAENEFSLTLSNDQQEKVVLNAKDGVLTFDRTASGITEFSADFPQVHKVDMRQITIRKISIYADLASLEIFINDGEHVLTELVFPNKPYQRIKLEKLNSQFTVYGIDSSLNE
ncbi:MAG: glycoside hydrolase family 32 protein [Cyclobacteriaceae bacterium]|nr:glycoside hydrolase family 32 protein [Cyclobacteriaceae bacterium]